MGDSVYIPQYVSPGSLIGEGYKAGFDIREGERKKALNRSFSESLNPDGSFNTEAFLSKASSEGIGPEAVTAWLSQKTAKSDTAAKEAMNATLLEASGRKPDVLRDWFEQEKQKKVEAQKEQEARIESERINNLPGADQFLNPSAGNSDISYTQPTTTQEQTITPESEQTLELGSSSLAEGKLTDPGYYGAGNVDVKLPEEQKRYDVVEEALRRKEGGTTAFGTASSSTPSSFSSDLTKWEPQDDGSNEFRNYKTTLDSQLKANGLGTASEYLQKIGEATYKQNLYTPNPLAMLGKDGKPDLASFGAENAKYEQSKVVAQGKAEEAILKARQDLIEGAKKFGVDEVEGRKQNISETIKLRDPSYRPQVAALVGNKILIDETKNDIKSASGDIQKLTLVAPSVIRALSTAANPAQQLSEGNLHENAMKLASNFTDDPNMIPKIIGGIVQGWKTGNWSSVSNLMKSSAEMMSPDVYSYRLGKMLHEAEKMNNAGMSTYTIGYKQPKEDKESPAPPPTKKEDKVGDELKAKVEKGKAARAKGNAPTKKVW